MAGTLSVPDSSPAIIAMNDGKWQAASACGQPLCPGARPRFALTCLVSCFCTIFCESRKATFRNDA